MSWIRAHLLSSPLNVALTFIGLALLLLIFVPLIDWGIIKADWAGTGPSACDGEGACWVFIMERLDFYIYGFYPRTQYWRVDIVFALLAALLIPQMISGVPGKRWLGWLTITAFPLVAYILLAGGMLGLPHVSTDDWGGLM